MKKWFIKRVKYNFHGHEWCRKYFGGYWERWYIDVIHCEIWIEVSKEQAYDPKFRPGCGCGTPQCEYYPINFFDLKSEFDIISVEREDKLNKLLV